ncbi:MAG TPA: DUF1553 domain-containing protein, partial [Tepidisphaeraceae bacterium]|nr:DUF1553 domain-containing protein [Tepidisphaeraceae bacterium]
NPEEGFNESVIGSGFWHLGEQVHGPVDVRQHQVDRVSNQIDVFAKAFLGLTVACARCHDHKFDAISTKDYYALFGVLESSRLQQAYLDPDSNVTSAVARMKQIVAEADALLSSSSPPVPTASAVPSSSFEDFSGANYAGWFPAGWAFGDSPTRRGQWDSLSRGAALAPPGVAHSGMLSPRLRGVLRSRSFTVPDGAIHYRLAGKGPGVQIRLIIDGYTMDAFNSVLFEGISFPVNTGGTFKWHRQDVRMYRGRRAHLELIDDGDGWLAVDEIRFSDPSTPFTEPPTPANPPLAASQDVATKLQALARRLEGEEQQLVEPMRAIAMTDGDGADGRVFVRGSHKNPGDVVPRRFLEALSGDAKATVTSGSGRLELARQVTDPSNPLTARVMANRVWHHLFGRGIVPTVDDFGVMGQPPTHPELLDYLADRFVKEGWSVKQLVRAIVLTSAYQMASRPADEKAAQQLDPQNTLLHHMPVRRLEGEAIRDAILAISGRLDRTVHAPTVEVHLTPFMEGRGRPKEGGPLDGNGVRTVYVAVRRNFLPPMMLAFDYPVPFNTIGRRSVSNVPAQALILMNDPFVVEQARRWAERELADPGLSPRQRVERMYLRAFSRPPTAEEVEEALAFLHQQGDAMGLSTDTRLNDVRVWSDFAHVLFNVKEFIFLN